MTACLFDTHLLLWAAVGSPRLPRSAAALMNETEGRRLFSAISLAEVSIKHAQRRPDFNVDPELLRQALLDNDYEELALTGEHALAIGSLPPIHKDPFDRMLVAQALVEGATLVTADAVLGTYPGRVMVV